jgi:hypothetical protein
LQALAEELGRSPTVADLKDASGYPPASRFLDEFGTWNAAKEAAGLPTYRKEGRGEPYTDAELLDLLRQRDRETDGPVTIRDMNDAEGYPSAFTYQQRFGSWNKAEEKAGLDTLDQHGPRQYSDAKLLAMLRSLAAETDHPLRVRDVEHAEDVPGVATFERRFGSWNKAKEQAGLETVGKGEWSRSPTYTDEELLELLRQRAAEVRGKLTKQAMDGAVGYPSTTTYTERFGSWTKAKKKAGLDD